MPKLNYIYIICPLLFDAVKIGRWSSSIYELYRRYFTYYGSSMKIYYWENKQPINTEKKIHMFLNNYSIDPFSRGELYKKIYLQTYIEYCNKVCQIKATLYIHHTSNMIYKKRLSGCLFNHIIMTRIMEHLGINSMDEWKTVNILPNTLNNTLNEIPLNEIPLNDVYCTKRKLRSTTIKGIFKNLLSQFRLRLVYGIRLTRRQYGKRVNITPVTVMNI